MEKANDGKLIMLRSLILSGGVHDSDTISIYNLLGELVARGHWYHDQILNRSRSFGIATREGHCVRFDLR